MSEKTHYRKAFKSPYLSSADIVGETTLTISNVRLEADKTKKTKDLFNTAYFAEKEIRQGEKLKPMILNATNSKRMHSISGSPFIDDWEGVRVVVYVDKNVKMMGDIVEGLRIKEAPKRPEVLPNTEMWNRAVKSFKETGNFQNVLKFADISEENQGKIRNEVENENQ